MKMEITAALIAMSTTLASAQPTTTCEGTKNALSIRVASTHYTYEASFDETVGKTLLRDPSGRTVASAYATSAGLRQVWISPLWTTAFAQSVADELERVFEDAQVQRCTSASEPFHSRWNFTYCPILLFVPDPDLEARLCPPIWGQPID